MAKTKPAPKYTEEQRDQVKEFSVSLKFMSAEAEKLQDLLPEFQLAFAKISMALKSISLDVRVINNQMKDQ